MFGEGSDAERGLGTVSLAELGRRVLAGGRLTACAPLVDLTDHATRIAVGRDHAALLARFGVPHLDETDLRSRDRAFTQALAGALHDAGQAALLGWLWRREGA